MTALSKRRILPLNVMVCVSNDRDAELIRKMLRSSDARPIMCSDIESLLRLAGGQPDVILICEQMLDEKGLQLLTQAVRSQPVWSDIPVLLVSAGAMQSYAAQRIMQVLSNVLLLDRPVHMPALSSSLKMAIRARMRQHHLRLMLEELRKRGRMLAQINDSLERQVSERTALAEARSKQLQSLAVELINAEEQERTRIAGLLHEDFQQLLAGARFMLQSGMLSVSDLEQVQTLIEQAIGKSRNLAQELSPAVLRHSGLVSALRWLSDQMREQFGLEVKPDIDDPGQAGDYSLNVFLFRSVQELLYNVVKHAGVKTASLAVSVTDTDITVTVSDEGNGFDCDVIETSDAKAGLGLISLRERASYIGGELKIESKPGQGSRFILKTPLELEITETRTGEQRSLFEPHAFDPGAASGHCALLLVDDHKVMRTGLLKLIESQPDIRVVGEASNGLEAVELTKQLKPDVIVMDVSMPVMDGIEATRSIKTLMPHIHIIGLSMFEDEHVTATMRQAGAEEFVSKTASSSELINAIYKVFKQQ